MIKLTKLNNEHFVINGAQIECIESIPDTKVIMMNREFFLVRETPDEIIDKIIEFKARIYCEYKKMTSVNKND